ncbi:cytochrome P450 [Microthyrium microscopicum]|uniref:Cytochrome P450 n=1 Tax=Microthyrium microscopicum TaxID=703497 RepID=A0A6A6UMX8_9PEZI|nr:cytochrome P450 [Microthyrium microscopicum]
MSGLINHSFTMQNATALTISILPKTHRISGLSNFLMTNLSALVHPKSTMFAELLRLVGYTIVIGTVFWAAWIYQRFFSRRGLPKDLPWADGSTSPWSVAKLHVRTFFGLKPIIQNGYYKFSKDEKVFLLPNVVTGPEVILPMSQMKWLLDQPDNVLNQNEVNREFLHADRTMLHSNIIRDMVHGRVIRREMTKELDTYSDNIVEEIEFALARNWGTDTTEWREVRVYDTLLDVISRISNRVLVGKELCRNEEYLRSSSTYSRAVVLTAGMLNLLPEYLRPIFSPIIMAYDMYHYRQITKFVVPLIKERAHQFKPGMDYRRPDYSENNDYVQWAMHDAYSHNDPLEYTPEMITKRLTVLSFAAIQSSVITISNIVFDLAASSQSIEYQAGLRDEVRQVTSQYGSKAWTRAGLLQMLRLDSALKESMRLWGFLSRGVMKLVVAPEGITLPDGHHLDVGAKVGVTSYAIHHDEDAYTDAFTFKPYRFLPKQQGSGPGAKAQPMVTSADEFMGFSHGRHACPGRFFAANQLKLLLAAIVTKYDIEPVAARPENPWLNNTIGPPVFSTLRIRRRPGTVEA